MFKFGDADINLASPVVQTVTNLVAMWETWIRSLGQEDPLEKGMATHSSILPWRVPWTEEPGGLQSMGLQIVRHDWATDKINGAPTFHIHQAHFATDCFKSHVYLLFLQILKDLAKCMCAILA